jgi:hypothetical protein
MRESRALELKVVSTAFRPFKPRATPLSVLASNAEPLPLPPNESENDTKQPAEPQNLFPRSRFSISTDHLIVLVQFNFYRACVTNINTLDLAKYFVGGCTNIISVPKLEAPPILYPTYLQRSIKHAPWIDSIPYPKIRDNLILASGKFSTEELFYEIFGELYLSTVSPGNDYEGEFDGERGGIVVWGEPWHSDCWEITPKQWKKFGFLYQGCEDVVVSTNIRRAERGEDPLDPTQFTDWEAERQRLETLPEIGPLEASVFEGEKF